MIGAELAKDATRDVAVGGYHWRVRRVTSLQLAEEGLGLLVGLPEAERTKRAGKGRGSFLKAKTPTISPELTARSKAFVQAALAAGAVGVSRDGKKWEALRIVSEADQADPSKNVLTLEMLPAGVDLVLFSTILDLMGGAVAVKALRSFHGRATRGDRRPGEEVQRAAR